MIKLLDVCDKADHFKIDGYTASAYIDTDNVRISPGVGGGKDVIFNDQDVELVHGEAVAVCTLGVSYQLEFTTVHYLTEKDFQ